MTKNYELAFKGYSHLNPNAKEDNDLETYDYLGCDSYREAVKYAKALSFNETIKSCGNIELVEVDIICYTETDCTSYSTLFEEEYRKGKKVKRYKGSYPY